MAEAASERKVAFVAPLFAAWGAPGTRNAVVRVGTQVSARTGAALSVAAMANGISSKAGKRAFGRLADMFDFIDGVYLVDGRYRNIA
jgi:hypothetical protein